MKAAITNTSKANQGVWTDAGLVHIAPGKTVNVAIAADYVKRAQSLPFLKVVDAKAEKDAADAKAKADAKAAADKAAADAKAAEADAKAKDAQPDARTDDELRAAVIEKLGSGVAAAALDRDGLLKLLAEPKA